MSDAAKEPRKLALGNFAFSFGAPAAPAPAPAEPPPAPHPGEPWFVIDNFLPEALADQIVETFIAHQAEFSRAYTISLVSEYRQALQIPPKLPIFKPFEAHLYRLLPSVQQRLGLTDTRINLVDMAGNAYPNGGQFKKHFDNAASVNASRVISYVYYLHRRPKAFYGGDLVIYPYDGGMLGREPLAVIPPAHNSIAFFRSEYLHEVTPVVVPSGSFAHSRFTINGWAHSAEDHRRPR